MAKPSPHTFGLLGMLAVRPWTSYELTQQVRRSLRFMWQTSEGHLYREQARLVTLGWAAVETEPVGRRTRKRYTITDEGRAALAEWLSTEPQEPSFQIEGIVRTFFGDQGSPAQLISSMEATAGHARAMRDELIGFVEEYLDEDGPMSMIEQGRSEPGHEREEFHGRPMYPERLHVVALSIDVITQLLETVDRFFADAVDEVSDWTETTDRVLAPRTRRRLENIRHRNRPKHDLPPGHVSSHDRTPPVGKLWKPVLNVTDLDEGERFWSAVCGLAPSGRHGQFAVLDPADGDEREPWMLLQVVPSIDDCGDGGAHIDLRVADVAAAVARVEDLGGSVDRLPEFYRPDGVGLLEWAVVRDPFGNPFCLVRWPLD